MSEFLQGQRWVIDSEPELGLGIVIEVAVRTVVLYFEQADCERRYAVRQAPLTRITYGVDDQILLKDGSTATVVAVHQQEGLMIYDVGAENLVVETALAGQIRLNQPFIRLMMGQLEKPSWFHFRRQLSAAIANTWHSGLNGLLGIRANLIPHQLYIAWHACDREQVRVLLADEVGLGKTIEAGMILARMLRLERVQRALILVPDALQVQWLVELIRRFSISPELYSGEEHDFHSGQIHIVPHSALSLVQGQLAMGEFDLTIVDEAHHLRPQTEAFTVLSGLANCCPHLVLLTATPEQLGVESHFERLKLLDPAKFSSLPEFLKQEESYAAINQAIGALPVNREQIINDYRLDSQVSDEDIVNQLLDYHGVGRVMFRNIRSHIAGFPKRLVVTHEIDDEQWSTRFEWLASWIKQQKEEKILVICHEKAQVQLCESYLWQKHGLDAAIFHEDQNLIERDKAAAYFADMEHGSQILICSEIGSEGRNFQFSHHLVCLDLPSHPDVLEQRIGRLDRLGQTRDVHIHFPLTADGQLAQQFHWYHRVLNCIEQQNPAAAAVHDELWPKDGDGQALPESLCCAAKEKVELLQQKIHQGRDALLEKNSCRQPMADQLADRIAAFEASTPLALIEQASELLGFYFEQISEKIYSLIPSDKMIVPTLPGVPLEGSDITFCRALANSREDLLFVTWDAPLVVGIWEMLQHSEIGSASVAMLPSSKLPEGHCLLEACYDLVIQSEHASQCRTFLNTLSVRSLVLDISENDLAPIMPEQALHNALQSIKKYIAKDIIKARKSEIPDWYKKAEALCEKQGAEVFEQAKENAKIFFDTEIQRLKHLAQRNDAVDQTDVEALEDKKLCVIKAITEHAHVQLSAIRLIVVVKPE